MGDLNKQEDDGLKQQLENKVENIDKFLDKCYRVLDDCSCSNKRYSLLSVTSIIIETGMINSFSKNKITNTGGICKLYKDGVLNAKYRSLITRIRSVRNNLVHLNVTTGKDTEKLSTLLISKDEKYFKDALKDLFGEDIEFDDKYLTKMYNLLTDILNIDTLTSAFDILLG